MEYHIDILAIRWSLNTTDYSWTSHRGSVLMDLSKFVNPTIYFEAVLKIDNASAIAYARLVNLGTSDVVDGGTEVPNSVLQTQSTDYVRLRSGALSLTNGNRYSVQIKTSNSAYYAWLNGARIIVVDDISAGWTKGEEKVEICCSGSYTPTIADQWATLTNSPIYKHEVSPRDGSLTAYFEVCLGGNTANKTVRAKLKEYDNPDLSDFGTDVANSQINITPASANVPVRARSSAITLNDGKYYSMLVTASKAGIAVIYCTGKIVIQQSGTITKTQLHKRISYLQAVSVTTFTRLWSQVYLDKSKLPVNQAFYYETTSRMDTAGYCGEARLYNADDDTPISDSTLQVCSTNKTWKISGSLSLTDLKQYDSQYRRVSYGSFYLGGSFIVINVSTVVHWKKLQYFTEPPTTGAFNKLKYASEPPVSGAWNKLLYEGE